MTARDAARLALERIKDRHGAFLEGCDPSGLAMIVDALALYRTESLSGRDGWQRGPVEIGDADSEHHSMHDGLVKGCWGIYQGSDGFARSTGRWFVVHTPTRRIFSEYGCPTQTAARSTVVELDALMDWSTYDNGKTVKTSDETRAKAREIRSKFERKTR